MKAQKQDRVRISFIISIVISLALLGWWAAVNMAMLSAIILPPHNFISQTQPRLHIKLSIPPASYKPIHYLFFGGKGSYGLIPAKQNLNVRQFSITFWAKSDGPIHGSFDRPIEILQWVRNYAGVPIAYGWGFDAGDQDKIGIDKLRFTVGNTLGNLFSAGPVSLSRASWTHIAGTFDGTSLNVYQNGVLIDAFPFKGSYSYPATALPIQLATGWLPHHYWAGDLSDIQIYGRPLSRFEISSIFNGQNETNGLIAHWALNEGSGILMHDSSGHNNNGVIHNGLWR
ncbi:MAG: LamG domain-containing protein [Thermoproteota archaeon]|nr:LamG domain-containing protein [Thermoproteota archaeon]